MEGDQTLRAASDLLGSVDVFREALSEWTAHELRGAAWKGITPAQMKLLKLVGFADGQRIGEVAAFLSITNAAASRAVERLVRRGLLHRTGDAIDRRAHHVSLTDQGDQLLAAYDEARSQKLADFFEDYSPDELWAAASFLDRISVGLITQGTHPDDLCFRCGLFFRERCLLRAVTGPNCIYHRLSDHVIAQGPGDEKTP